MIDVKALKEFLRDKPDDMPVHIMLETRVNGIAYQIENRLQDHALARNRIVLIGNEIIGREKPGGADE